VKPPRITDRHIAFAIFGVLLLGGVVVLRLLVHP
jgi:hypothetical protein